MVERQTVPKPKFHKTCSRGKCFAVAIQLILKSYSVAKAFSLNMIKFALDCFKHLHAVENEPKQIPLYTSMSSSFTNNT